MDNKTVFVTNVEEDVLQNIDYRRVKFTLPRAQLVYMSLEPGVEIGNEIHGIDQFIRIEKGNARSVIGNGTEERVLKAGDAIMIPAGTWHNIINDSDGLVKLYTLYCGPQHLRDTVQPTKADEVEDHFDGITSLA